MQHPNVLCACPWELNRHSTDLVGSLQQAQRVLKQLSGDGCQSERLPDVVEPETRFPRLRAVMGVSNRVRALPTNTRVYLRFCTVADVFYVSFSRIQALERHLRKVFPSRSGLKRRVADPADPVSQETMNSTAGNRLR